MRPTAVLLAALLLPQLAAASDHREPAPPPEVPAAPAAADASSSASADAAADASAAANPVSESVAAVTFPRERRVRTLVGGATPGYLGDALDRCQERTGVKSGGGLVAWGGRVRIDDFCLDCRLLIEAGYPELCAQMVAERRGLELPARRLAESCGEREARRDAACEAK